jgi:hypothetical protein
MQCTAQEVTEYTKILLYAACKGAVLTQRGRELVMMQRDCTRAALQGLVRARRRGLSGVALPNEVVDIILLMAELELEESCGHQVGPGFLVTAGTTVATIVAT